MNLTSDREGGAMDGVFFSNMISPWLTVSSEMRGWSGGLGVSLVM